MKYMLKVVLIGQLTLGAWVGACSPITPPPSVLQAYHALEKLKIGDMTCPEYPSSLKLNSCVLYKTASKDIAYLQSLYLQRPYKKLGNEWIIEEDFEHGVVIHIVPFDDKVLVGWEDRATSYEVLESLMLQTLLKVYSSCVKAGFTSQQSFKLKSCKIIGRNKGPVYYSAFLFSVSSSSDGTITPGRYYYEALVQTNGCPGSLLQKVGDL